MSYKSVTCFVLKSVNYRDADKIFTLYSLDEGLLSAAGRGVRKISSRRAGSLDTLNKVRLTYFESSIGHKTITEVKALNSFRGVKGDKDKVAIAYKMVALVLKHIEPGSSERHLFITLERSLDLLDSGVVLGGAVLVYFYINFMYVLGYRLQLKKCVHCGDMLSKEWSYAGFDIEKGGLVCGRCREFESELGLRGAALLNKLQVLREKDFRYFDEPSENLLGLEALLQQYIDYKLS